MGNKGTWKIEIGGQPFADYTDVLQPEGVPGGPELMEINGYGAPGPVYLNLGNTKLARRFTLTREHDDDTDAHDWYQTAAATWAGAADVILTHIDYAGAETKYKITGAKVELDVMTPIGPTTITKLTFTGGPASLL